MKFTEQQRKWATQQLEVQKLPPGERSLMESAYQMLQQKVCFLSFLLLFCFGFVCFFALSCFFADLD